MSNYKFKKVRSIKINGAAVQVYEVYKIVEEAEIPGVTAVTSVAEVFAGRVSGRTLADAQQHFYDEMCED